MSYTRAWICHPGRFDDNPQHRIKQFITLLTVANADVMDQRDSKKSEIVS